MAIGTQVACWVDDVVEFHESFQSKYHLRAKEKGGRGSTVVVCSSMASLQVKMASNKYVWSEGAKFCAISYKSQCKLTLIRFTS